MTERAKRLFPSRAQTKRALDLAWISDSAHVSWSVAQRGLEEHGRGAIVVDTTQRPTAESDPFGYFPQAVVEQTGDEDTQRMVTEYDPSWEMVTVLLKAHDRISTYRVGVLPRRPGE